MGIISETPTKDTSGYDYIYQPIDNLLTIPGTNIGQLDVNGSAHGYSHVDGQTATYDYDTYQTRLTAGEKYRLVFTPDTQSNFYANSVAWVQDSSGSDADLIMNLIGSSASYVNGSLYSSIFDVEETGKHYFSFNFVVGYDKQLTGSIADFGYTISLQRVGASIIDGNGRDNKLVGDAGQNIISGFGGDDTLKGLGGADTLYGGPGSDHLNGGAGKDKLSGDAGRDTLIGGTEDDRLSGGIGNDTLKGGTGNDKIFGNSGNDKLFGGAGKDTLSGGGGNDTFHFAEKPGGRNADTITDFEANADQIGFALSCFEELDDKGSLDADMFTVGRFAKTSDQHVIYHAASGKLFYDADGVGGADALLVAYLDPGLKLSADEFFVY